MKMMKWKAIKIFNEKQNLKSKKRKIQNSEIQMMILNWELCFNYITE